jgi:hypothetical protein
MGLGGNITAFEFDNQVALPHSIAFADTHGHDLPRQLR